MAAAAQHLVLVGGGHSHALLLKHWAARPLPGVHITLISPQRYTPYSGMLPGLIAGHYDFYDTHIDLQSVCQKAGATLLSHRVTGIDSVSRRILMDDNQSLSFDVLSVNSGITPALPSSLQGRVIAVKPIADFYPRWQAELHALQQMPATTTRNYAVVGGGAAGVELVMAMQHRLCQPDIDAGTSLTLIYRGERPLEGYASAVRDKIESLLSRKKIRLLPHTEVTAHYLNTQDYDRVFWCTQAQPADWLQKTDLQLSDRGFIAVNAHLQSVSCNNVFAVGDVADMRDQNLPKAGVYAVRQADTLMHNLRARLQQQPLQIYRPQHSFLSLLACGDRSAIATRVNGWFPAFFGGWVWRWKDRIDRAFMQQF